MNANSVGLDMKTLGLQSAIHKMFGDLNMYNRRNFLATLFGTSAALFLPKTIVETPWKKRIITPLEFKPIPENAKNQVYINYNNSLSHSLISGYYYTNSWHGIIPGATLANMDQIQYVKKLYEWRLSQKQFMTNSSFILTPSTYDLPI